jgi:ABC-type iron transport system FetAB permease component
MKLTKLLVLALSLTLAACSEKKETSEKTAKGGSNTLLSIVLTSAPDQAIDIADLRKSGKPGDTVTFTGHVLGSDAVFMDGRAVMVMGDP